MTRHAFHTFRPLKTIGKYLNQALSPGLPPWIKACLLQQESGNGLRQIEKAREDRIAVLAPHPDDDVIGCGGTLYKHRLAGDHITVIYLTDGACGDDYSGPPSLTLAAQRRREATAAAGLLGIEELKFLNYPDGKLPSNTATAQHLLKTLKEVKAQAIFLPFLLDEHPDHIATNRLFAKISPELAPKATVYAYEVWAPLRPNRVIDISSVLEKKKEAIRKHVSQMDHIDYAEAIAGLNKYRSMSTGSGRGHYEAFFEMKAARYGLLANQILGTK